MTGWMNARTDEWMDGWMDGWIDGWMDGWMDGFVRSHLENGVADGVGKAFPVRTHVLVVVVGAQVEHEHLASRVLASKDHFDLRACMAHPHHRRHTQHRHKDAHTHTHTQVLVTLALPTQSPPLLHTIHTVLSSSSSSMHKSCCPKQKNKKTKWLTNLAKRYPPL